MKKIVGALLLSSAFILTGCQTTVQYKYDENKSQALNYAHAGGINTGIEDAEVPKESISKINSGLLAGAFEGSIGYMTASTINLTNPTGLILGFLSGISEAPHPSQRTAIFAYMPASEASSSNDARQKMTDIIEEAFKKSFDELGATSSDFARHNMLKHLLAYSYGGVLNCPEYDGKTMTQQEFDDTVCEGSVSIQKPSLLNITNSDWLTSEPSVYYFSAKRGHVYNKINFNPKNNKSDTAKVMTLFSKNLPNWLFIYVAPKDTLDENGEPINYPYILNKGKAHYFVKAKD